jgi:hypothetical protein
MSIAIRDNGFNRIHIPQYFSLQTIARPNVTGVIVIPGTELNVQEHSVNSKPFASISVIMGF